MQISDGRVAADKHAAPDQWADPTQDDAELIDDRGRRRKRLNHLAIMRPSPPFRWPPALFPTLVVVLRVPGDRGLERRWHNRHGHGASLCPRCRVQRPRQPSFARHKAALPKRVRVSIGWPSRKATSRTGRRIGECWAGEAATDGVPQLFISPTLASGVEVAAVVVHEPTRPRRPPAAHSGRRCWPLAGIRRLHFAPRDGPVVIIAA